MKKITFTLIFLTFGLFLANGLYAQCTPGDSLSCPDPENNGEICPETLEGAITGQDYLQEFTIIAPSEYIIDTASGTIINLHHIKIKDVGNLPDGITWQSNAPDSVFNVGTYYCVLLEGIPNTAGNYPLKIIVDVYIPGILGSPPIYVATITDSTSLAIDVNPNGVYEFAETSMKVLGNSPNPFSKNLDISYFVPEQQEVTFKVFDLLGSLIYEETMKPTYGENHINFDGSFLKPGMYIYSLSNKKNYFTQRIIKSN